MLARVDEDTKSLLEKRRVLNGPASLVGAARSVAREPFYSTTGQVMVWQGLDLLVPSLVTDSA